MIPACSIGDLTIQFASLRSEDDRDSGLQHRETRDSEGRVVPTRLIILQARTRRTAIIMGFADLFCGAVSQRHCRLALLLLHSPVSQ
jgi:hypothetical protein